ncbi:MAG: hypothetical protein JO215_11510 [Ktedonobacteraceae bacterium]|nr:hypothetical protein [Ktedonobacteraceae bacterium]
MPVTTGAAVGTVVQEELASLQGLQKDGDRRCAIHWVHIVGRPIVWILRT